MDLFGSDSEAEVSDGDRDFADEAVKSDGQGIRQNEQADWAPELCANLFEWLIRQRNSLRRKEATLAEKVVVPTSVPAVAGSFGYLETSIVVLITTQGGSLLQSAVSQFTSKLKKARFNTVYTHTATPRTKAVPSSVLIVPEVIGAVDVLIDLTGFQTDTVSISELATELLLPGGTYIGVLANSQSMAVRPTGLVSAAAAINFAGQYWLHHPTNRRSRVKDSPNGLPPENPDSLPFPIRSTLHAGGTNCASYHSGHSGNSSKIGKEVPWDSSKIGKEVPWDSSKIGKEVPWDSSKVGKEVPWDSSKVGKEVPWDSSKIGKEVPWDLGSLSMKIPEGLQERLVVWKLLDAVPNCLRRWPLDGDVTEDKTTMQFQYRTPLLNPFGANSSWTQYPCPCPVKAAMAATAASEVTDLSPEQRLILDCSVYLSSAEV
jgi:hypothetical protein